MPQRIGEILIGRGKLDPANLERALKLQEGETREKIGVILLRLGMVSGRDLADALADQLDLPLASTADFPELPLLEERLSSKFLRDAQAVPLREDDDELAIAIADPTDSFVIGLLVSVICFWGCTGLKKMIGADDSLDVFGVHALGGIFGALATGIFNDPTLGGPGLVTDWVMGTVGYPGRMAQLIIQAKAVGLVFVWTAVVAFISFQIVKFTVGLRVSEEEEREGLDITAHGERAYTA